MCSTYNGYRNWETFVFANWLENDRALYSKWHAIARSLRKDAARFAECLERDFLDHDPTKDQNNPYHDLLAAALDAVDWTEVAESFLTE